MGEKSQQYSHFVIKNTQYGNMLLNPQDQYIGRELLYKGTWESYLLPVFKKHINKNDCVIDMGANIGSHTLSFSKLVGENGVVHCFEPLKDTFFQLKFNIVLNKCNNVILYNYGLSDKEEDIYLPQLDLTKSDNFGCKSLRHGKSEKIDNYQKIETITLDSLDIAPKFIKMDVENFEDRVLLGAKNTILKHKPIMVIEIHEKDLDKVTKILNNELNYIIKQKLSHWDYLCMPKI